MMSFNDDMRRGRFYLDHQRYTVEELFDLMKNFLVFKCEYSMHRQQLEYFAISPLFTSIERHAELPLYRIEVLRREVFVKLEQEKH